MKISKLFQTIFVGTIALFAVACSNDDDNSSSTPTQATKYDDLEYLESSLYTTDSLGNLGSRIYGSYIESMSSGSNDVYIGVKDIEEAKTLFKSWFPDEATMQTDGDNIVVNLTDTLARQTGKTVTLAAVTGDSKIIARMTLGGGASLKYITRINFLNANAWPENGVYSPYKLFDCTTIDKYSRFENFDYAGGDPTPVKYMCIREAQKGVSGMLVCITNNIGTYRHESYRLVGKSLAVELSKIINTNFTQYANAFAACGMKALKDDPDQWFAIAPPTITIYRNRVQLSTGKLKRDYSPIPDSRRGIFVEYFGTTSDE